LVDRLCVPKPPTHFIDRLCVPKPPTNLVDKLCVPKVPALCTPVLCASRRQNDELVSTGLLISGHKNASNVSIQTAKTLAISSAFSGDYF